MNRYTRYTFSFSTPVITLLVALTLLLVSSFAESGVRNFPKNAERGELRVVQGMVVTLNGQREQMAPGVLIKSTANTSVVPMALVGRTHVINFTRNGQGQVNKVWLLTLAEAKLPAPKKSKSKGLFSALFAPAESPKDDGNTPYDQLPAYGK